MIKTISNKNILVFSAAAAIVLVFFINHLSIIAAVAAVLLLWLVIEKETIPAILLALSLTVISDIDENLRLFVNVFILFALSFYFIKKYGLSLKTMPKLPQPIISFVLLVSASTILAALFSNNISISLIFIVKEIIFFLLVYLFFSFIKSESTILHYIYALIVPAVIISAAVIYTFYTSDILQIMFQTLGHARSTGYIGNIASAGGLLTITIGLTFYLIIINNSLKKSRVLFLYLILLLQIVGLILTNSRAAFLGSFITLSFIVLSYYKNKRIHIVFGAIAFIAVILISNPKILDAFLLLIRAERVFENPRYNLWDISFSIIKDNILFGSGPGNFAAYMYKYNPTMLNSFASRDIQFIHDFASVGHSHNFFLFKFSETGLLGLANAVLLPYLFFLFAIRIKNRLEKSDFKNYWLVITIIGCGLGMFARSIFESTGLLSYGWITRDLPFWILFSIIIYLYKIKYLPAEDL